MAKDKSKKPNDSGKYPQFVNVEKDTFDYLEKQKEDRGINKGVMVDLAVKFYKKFSGVGEDKLSKLISK